MLVPPVTGSARHVAALNNAELCDVVCRTHGITGRFDYDAWTSPVRTPPLYPDAVTLIPGGSVTDLLRRLDRSAGCSIKDSFATLNLEPYGFRVLFDATWIVRTPSEVVVAPSDGEEDRWTIVRTPARFAAWESAWRRDDPSGVLLVDLLDQPSVTLIAVDHEGAVRAGAVLNRSAGAVGISNFFATARASNAWAGCVAFATSLFPGATLVGYESGRDLEAARAHGFEEAGPLRVWRAVPPAD